MKVSTTEQKLSTNKYKLPITEQEESTTEKKASINVYKLSITEKKLKQMSKTTNNSVEIVNIKIEDNNI